MAKKSTINEVDARIHETYKLLLSAWSRTEIIRHGSETWGIGERQVENYISEARKLLALDAELERPQWLQSALARLLAYEKQAAQQGQLNTAIAALEKQAKLLRFEMT